MYKKILVPLDGSSLAECVLPHVETVTRGCQSPEVTFLRVAEPVSLPSGALSDGGMVYSEAESEAARKKADAANMQESKDYLTKLVSGLNYGGSPLRTEVIKGKPADVIADYAKKNNFDLIVIATHGRAGVSRWIMGSTADKILRSACVPVFMIRPPGCIPGF